jgi:riboflavin synthase
VFTGIAMGRGRIVARQNKGPESLLSIESDSAWDPPLDLGESISVSGVCLTVTEALGAKAFKAFASKETLSLTTLGTQDAVNLERALRLTDRLGGHIVSGHVDALTTLISKTREGNSQKLTFSLPAHLAPLVVSKGSITIDGISLTVNDTAADSFTLNVIPHTSKLTTLASKGPGQTFNLEVDILGRYVKRLLEASALISPNLSSSLTPNPSPDPKAKPKPPTGLTIEELIAQGF